MIDVEGDLLVLVAELLVLVTVGEVQPLVVEIQGDCNVEVHELLQDIDLDCLQVVGRGRVV